MKKLTWFFVVFFALGLVSAHAMAPRPSQANFQTPTINLEFFEVPQFDGFWYYSQGVKPTKGDPGDRGAPLPMSFLLTIDNPNPYPVKLEGIKFTVCVDGFDLVTVNNDDAYILPAKSADQVRVTTMVTARSVLLSLLVTGGFQLKARDMNAWGAMEKWWKGLADYTIPVRLKEGTAIMNAGPVTQVVPFDLSSS